MRTYDVALTQNYQKAQADCSFCASRYEILLKSQKVPLCVPINQGIWPLILRRSGERANHEFGIALVPGVFFGAEGYKSNISYAYQTRILSYAFSTLRLFVIIYEKNKTSPNTELCG